eukprot:gene39-70_t
MTERQLLILAKEGKTAEVDELLANGVDVNCRDEDGRTPLHWAVTNKHQLLVSHLLSKGAVADTVDEGGITPLMTACAVGIDSIVDMILQASPGPIDQQHSESNNKTALLIACSKGHISVAAKLLQLGASASAADGSLQTALHRAVIKGSGDLVLMLLKAGADVNAQDRVGDTPLHYASLENN